MHSQKYLLIIVKIKLICLTLFLEMTVPYFCYIAFLEPPSDQIASQLQKSEFLENLIYQLSGTIKKRNVLAYFKIATCSLHQETALGRC